VTIYTGLLEGRCHPWTDVDSRAETSAADIAEIPERDPTALAALIERDAPTMVTAFRAYGAKPITYVFGTPASATTALAVMAGDFLIHGWDIAQAVGVRWPIAPADAIVIARGLCEVLPMFVAPAAAHFQGTYEVSLRGGPIITMRFSDGRLTFAEGRQTGQTAASPPTRRHSCSAPTADSVSGHPPSKGRCSPTGVSRGSRFVFPPCSGNRRFGDRISHCWSCEGRFGIPRPKSGKCHPVKSSGNMRTRFSDIGFGFPR
jgi:uncharacterized protein (TIGR03083 family)